MRSRPLLFTFGLLLIHAVAHVTAARTPGEVGGIQVIQGIPVCAAGLPACGLHGCYTQLLSKCDPAAGCISVKLLSQISSFVRFGSSSSSAPQAGACPIPFANKCGDQFCGMGEVCAAGRCQHTTPQQFVAYKVGNSVTAAKAACIAARHSSPACAADTSEMTPVECNSIGVASIKGIFCFQSAQFNCGVQPGGSATFTCRGLAGVAQTVGEVWNTTINTAAKVAEEMADAIAKREQQAAAAARAKAGSSTPLVLAGPVAPTTTSSSSKHSSVAHGDGSSSGDGVVVGGNGGQAWRAGANAALEAVRDQPFFQNLAHMVSNATHSLLNKTADGVVSVAESAKSAFGVGRQTTFDLGPPPIKDAAGGLAAHTATLLLVALLSVALLGL